MSKWTMIDVTYARIPEEVKYQVKIAVNEAEMVQVEEERKLIERDLGRNNLNSVPMEAMVEELHQLLQKYPEAKVTMMQEPTRPLRHTRQKRGFELDQKTVDLIRDNLEEAQKLFAPIERTVQIRPAPVRLEPQGE